mmetsp:Transcript_66377/g.154251  ORF Transcript_66377/g.154251 Transcript_66377/m.154251 type:complete len:739 (-) Transcript_66377:93-2309(-)
MADCSWLKAVLEGDPSCSKERWIVFGGLIALMLSTVCCAVLAFWLLYYRLVNVATAASVASGCSDSRVKDHDPHEELRNKTALPMLLFVCSPTHQTSCTGEYELVLNGRPNGQPHWAKRSGGRWLYSGKDGRWYIGGLRSKDKNFACSSGFIYCNKRHGNKLPPELNGGWEWGQGSLWHKDPSITVAVMEWMTRKEGVSGSTFSLDSIAYKEAAALPPALLSEAAGVWRTGKDELREDGPGLYVITHDHTAVTPGVLLAEPIDFLSAGTCVNVVEVTRCDLCRVRGRLEKPEGWISLENTQDGYRWARRQSTWDTSTEATTSPPSLQIESTDSFTDSGSFDQLERTVAPVSTAAGPNMGNLRMRAGDSETPEVPEKDPPAAICICTPNGQTACGGIYELVPDEQPNGCCLWKQRKADHWLYCKNGRWSVAGLDVKKDRFTRSAGFISQTDIQRHLLPHAITTPWQRWDGTRFVEDPDILVVAVDEPVCPSSCDTASTLEAHSSPPTPSSGSSSSPPSSIEVMLERLQADSGDAEGVCRWQRCIGKVVASGSPWRIGPRLQPQVFTGLNPKAWAQECLFELSWRQPCLYLARPAPGVLLVDGVAVRQPQTRLRHGSEIGLCTAESALPVVTFRVVNVSDAEVLQASLPKKEAGSFFSSGLGAPWTWGDTSSRWNREALLSVFGTSWGPSRDPEAGASGDRSPPSKERKPRVMDLRGCGLSTEGKSVVQACKTETLRVIV